MQVVRIFTDMSISPSLSLRQYADRYTFRAGRNLPDKEFRYLWTVIVTAAVYQGLGHKRSKKGYLDQLRLTPESYKLFKGALHL